MHAYAGDSHFALNVTGKENIISVHLTGDQTVDYIDSFKMSSVISNGM